MIVCLYFKSVSPDQPSIGKLAESSCVSKRGKYVGVGGDREGTHGPVACITGGRASRFS